MRELDAATAGALAEFRGSTLRLDAISLSREAIEALARFAGQSLRLPVGQVLSARWAPVMASFRVESIYVSGSMGIDEDDAEGWEQVLPDELAQAWVTHRVRITHMDHRVDHRLQTIRRRMQIASLRG